MLDRQELHRGLLNRRNISIDQQTGIEEFETFHITELGTH